MVEKKGKIAQFSYEWVDPINAFSILRKIRKTSVNPLDSHHIMMGQCVSIVENPALSLGANPCISGIFFLKEELYGFHSFGMVLPLFVFNLIERNIPVEGFFGGGTRFDTHVHKQDLEHIGMTFISREKHGEDDDFQFAVNPSSREIFFGYAIFH